MRWLLALSVTAAVVALTVAFAFTRYDFLSLVVLLETAFLVAVDSAWLELNRYQVPIRVSPPMAVFGNVLTLGPIYLPFYLVVRSRRVAGELKLKEKYRSELQTAVEAFET